MQTYFKINAVIEYSEQKHMRTLRIGGAGQRIQTLIMQPGCYLETILTAADELGHPSSPKGNALWIQLIGYCWINGCEEKRCEMIGKELQANSSAPPAAQSLICGSQSSPGKLSPHLKRPHTALRR